MKVNKISILAQTREHCIFVIITENSVIYYQMFASYLLGGPLEAGDDGILDLVEVLDSLGAVDEDVGAGGVGAEAPDLPGLSDVVLVLVSQVSATGLEVVTSGNIALKLRRDKLGKKIGFVVILLSCFLLSSFIPAKIIRHVRKILHED